MMLNEWFPSLEWWEIFFDKGIIEKKILDSVLSTSKYFQNEKSPNFLKMINYTQLSDEDFKMIRDELFLEYENGIFEDIGIIKHIVGIFLSLSENGLYTKEKNIILDDAKKYIDTLVSKNLLSPKYSDQGSYMTWSFISENTNEFQKLNEYIKEKQEQVRLQNAPEEALNLMAIMKSDINAFINSICRKSFRTDISIKETYHDFPIFSKLSAKIFLDSLLTLSNDDKGHIFWSFTERYSLLNVNTYPILVNDLDFLTDLQELIEQEVNKRQGELSGFILDSINKEYLKKAIDCLVNVKNSSQQNNT